MFRYRKAKSGELLEYYGMNKGDEMQLATFDHNVAALCGAKTPGKCN
jgi:hypothetical protein